MVEFSRGQREGASSWWDDSSHPGLLPEEKEKRSQRLGLANIRVAERGGWENWSSVRLRVAAA